MSYIKRTIAFVLILAMTLGLAVAGYAATSPGGGPVNPGYDPETQTDTEKVGGAEVVYKIGETATVLSVEQDPENPKTTAKLYGGKDGDGKEVGLKDIGDGKKGIFEGTKTGKKFTKVVVKSTQRVYVRKKAFKGSKVSKVQIKGQKSRIDKGAFSGTKQKKVTIELKGAKKASDISVTKGSFDGLSKDSKIVVSKKGMSDEQYAKLVKKLRTAGFTGSIVRK